MKTFRDKARDIFEDEMSDVTLSHIREIDYLEDWIIDAMIKLVKDELKDASDRVESRVDWQFGIPYAVVDKESITKLPYLDYLETIYLKQPENSRLCGQYCLAMALGKSVEEIISVIKTKGGTRNILLYKVFDYYGIEYEYKRCRNPELIPDNSIVKIGYEGYRNTHYVFKSGEYFFDPYYGVLRDYSGIGDVVHFISYIQILKDET